MSEYSLLMVVLVAVAFTAGPAHGCTRYLWNTSSRGVYVSRTMDWPESTDPKLTLFPRGMIRHGGEVGGHLVVKDNPATWTSQHASLVTTVYGIGTVDGLNEKGLCGHALYLKATNFGERDLSKPGVQAGLWLQYVLDNAATVAEAVAILDDVQVVMVEAHGRAATIHLALEDARGDSAGVEYVEGEKTVYHGEQYRIMTNDPPYNEQLELLSKLDFSRPSRDTPLPGNVNPRDRFQRAAYYGELLPEPKSEREAIASVLAIARNVSVPFGAPYGEFGVYNTEYRTAANLKDLRYFFELTTNPSVIWVEIEKFDLKKGAPVMILDPNDIGLAGDVSDKFEAVDAPPF
ncbi:MAG: linear amide C-N hydrolase [Rhodopirellula sp. JB044]|uniref:linear amide C-N hydrolase n=1 Tax=Rhodopirellula sp. JB044 TaxID=3342844 RepID=UPI00370C310E